MGGGAKDHVPMQQGSGTGNAGSPASIQLSSPGSPLSYGPTLSMPMQAALKDGSSSTLSASAFLHTPATPKLMPVVIICECARSP